MLKQFEIIIGNCGQINKIFYFNNRWNYKNRNTRTITWEQARDNLVYIFQRYKSPRVAQPGNQAI